VETYASRIKVRSRNSFNISKANVFLLCSSISNIADEYTRYYDSPTLLDIEDTRQQWQEATQQRNFPNLSKIALDFLSIPVMSTEPERIFSSIGITLTNRQNKLLIVNLEALEQLKSWYKLRELKVYKNQE
jgi:hypothetical protein